MTVVDSSTVVPFFKRIYALKLGYVVFLLAKKAINTASILSNTIVVLRYYH